MEYQLLCNKLEKIENIVKSETWSGQSNLAAHTTELEDRWRETIASSSAIGEFFIMYKKLQMLLENVYQNDESFITVSEKMEQILCIEQGLNTIASIYKDKEKMEDLETRILGSEAFKRTCAIDSDILKLEMQNKSQTLEFKNIEHELTRLVEQYQNEISALSEIFVCIDAYLAQVERKKKLNNKK